MKRFIFCRFLKKKSEGQDFPPYPGELGKKIYEQISKEAWKEWLEKQTILINEKKLNMLKITDRMQVEKKMKLFLFSK